MFIFQAYRSILLSSIILTACFLLSACENDEKDINRWTREVNLKETAVDVDSYLSEDGLMKARLRAPLMYRVNTDTVYVEFPNRLHVDFFDSSRNVETWLDARYGKYYENYNKVYLRDSVVVITVNGDTLRTPDLWWDQTRQLFYTDKYAIYRGAGKNIYGGKGLEASQDLKRITFKQPTGNMKVSESGFPD